MDTLNIFKKYKNKEDHHEDQLTFSFLILLSYSKIFQNQFMNYLSEKMRKSNINPSLIPNSSLDAHNGLTEIKTQVSTERIKEYDGRLISILLTDDKIEYNGDIKPSDRKGILDGLIITDDGYIISIENKPKNHNVWFEQLAFQFPDTIEYEKTPIILFWREIISNLNIILENNIAEDIECKIIKDFLLFINEYFPYLKPYDNFLICGDNDELLKKRCESILEKLKMGNVSLHKGWHNSAKINLPELREIALYPDKEKSDTTWGIHLEVYPGDTMSQSLELYNKIDINSFSKLSNNKKWKIETNFHFSFGSQGLLWTNSNISLKEYIRLWNSIVHKSELNQITRDEWIKYLLFLKDKNILDDLDISNFKDKIESKEYQTLNICPGLCISYCWTKEEVLNFEKENKFIEEVKSRLNEVLSTWNQKTTHNIS